jgi:UDP-N-acetylmuramoylalanine--D-glutamate ligase
MCRSAELKTLVAGNIGLPPLDALTDSTDFDVAVLELSSFQLETTSQVPAEAAAILNISADHMDRYDSMGDYMLAKARILRGAKQAVLPRHDEWLNQITNVNTVLSFELDEPIDDASFGVVRKSGKRWLMKGNSKLMKLYDVPLTGLHNIKNVLSAFALVDSLNLPIKAVVKAVKEFKGLPHRMQTVANHSAVQWVNDSKATNIGATTTALNNIEKDIVWIAGGQGKGADFTELKSSINSHIKHVVLIGEDAGQIEKVLTGLVPVSRAASMQAAVDCAAELAEANSVVLLSPACASFDMFSSFENRGDEFARCVNTVIARGAV